MKLFIYVMLCFPINITINKISSSLLCYLFSLLDYLAHSLFLLFLILNLFYLLHFYLTVSCSLQIEFNFLLSSNNFAICSFCVDTVAFKS